MKNPENLIVISENDYKRLFPYNKTKARITSEGYHYLTPYAIADKTSNAIILAYKKHYKRFPTSIIDSSANVGGNCISFAKAFSDVLAFEIKEKTSEILKYNLEQFNVSAEVICGDFTKYLSFIKNYDIIYIDPPWYIDGHPNLDLSLANELPAPSIEEIMIRIWSIKDIMIAVKVPKNYSLKINETQRVEFKKLDVLIFVG